MPVLSTFFVRGKLSRVLIPACALAAAACHAATAVPDFQRQVRPILSDNCFLCHGPDKGNRMADLRLDLREGAFAVRKNGSVIVPGKPDESLLIKRITSDDPAFRMPPLMSHKTLTSDQKDILKRWIASGATWKEHWAFIAPIRPTPPAADVPAWDDNPIDRFLLARMEKAGLKPNPQADRRALIRRVTLDLIGLPPTPEEVNAFLADKSPNAYEKLVDRLLASPRYGEHRARYWLDAARYADTQGLHIDNYREMWPYRDWVIQAFNRNMPFDQFTIEQLGGDLLPNATLNQVIASGFHRCNVSTNEGGSIPAEVEAIYAKDRADTTGTVWLGLTVGCATCHDHKFDPISQKDYYSLTAFFRNTTQNAMDGNVPDTPPTVVVPDAQDRERWEQLNEREKALKQIITHAEASPSAPLESWLAKPEAIAAPVEPSAISIGLSAAGSSLHVVQQGKTSELPVPEGVKIGGGPPIAPAASALHFEKEGSVSLANVAGIDSDRPFSVSAWVYLPSVKDGFSVVSQYETLPKKPGDESGVRRGWGISISKDGPRMRLQDENDKYLDAQPATGYELKPEAWYHIVFTYDGSRDRRGIGLYVNGHFVPTYGDGNDLNALAGSIRNTAPLMVAKNDKTYFPGGAIADLNILDRAIEATDAIALANRIAVSSAAGQQAPLGPEQKAAITRYWAIKGDDETKAAVTELNEIDREREALRRKSAVTFVMRERTDAKPTAHVLYRGQYDAMRDEVPAKTLGVLPPMPEDAPRNRLGLGQWLVNPNNPLTARVTVNRFWLEVFGAGIVKTAEDFGSQGEPPSHPELLDWLAVEFRDSGWDVKKLFRLMVTSAAYRQSSAATEEKVQKDPDNRLLARGPRFRMDAEMVRDYALAASGLLRPEIGGPSVKPYQPERIWETVAMDISNTRFYKRDTGDALYRRSMYTFWKRSAPPPSMDIFNAPTRETCTVRRERTNTPLQALVTMNDPQFVEAARVLAQNALLAGGKELNGEVDYMTMRLAARPFDPKEKAAVKQSYKDYLAYYQAQQGDADKLLHVGESPFDNRLAKPTLAAMTMVANELMNLDEVLVK
jgi:hypothetical protein